MVKVGKTVNQFDSQHEPSSTTTDREVSSSVFFKRKLHDWSATRSFFIMCLETTKKTFSGIR